MKDFFLSYKIDNELRGLFHNKTLLKIVNYDGDIVLKGECIEYKTEIVNIDTKGIYKNLLKVKIKIIFINNKYPDKNFECEFYDSRYFNDNNAFLHLISSIETSIAKKLSNEIFNKICEDW